MSEAERVLFDLPAEVTGLPRGAGSGPMAGLPEGAVHARNDTGSRDFAGAFPLWLAPVQIAVLPITSPDIVSGRLDIICVGRRECPGAHGSYPWPPLPP